MRRILLVVLILASATSSASAGVDVQVTRYFGADRYGTAAAAAGEPVVGENVVLVSGEVFADALSATPVIAEFGGDLLFTRRDELPDATAAAMEARETPTGDLSVTIIGGNAAVSESVELDLQNRGYDTVRIAGQDRFETATRAAIHISDSGCHCPPATAVVANGADWADAVAAGPLFRTYRSVLLTHRDALPQVTRNHLRSSIDSVVIVGGTAAVSKQVEDEIRAICDPQSTNPDPCIQVRRIAGDNRQATAAAIAEFANPNASRVDLARGDLFPDALAAGAHAARHDAVVLLTRSPDMLSNETEAHLRSHRLTIADLFVFGDDGAVTPAVVAQAKQAATT